MKKICLFKIFLGLALTTSSFAGQTDSPSVLLVYAHPDDETAIGGILGRLLEAKIPVHAIYITRGEGSPVNHVDPSGENPELRVGKIRPRELQAVSRYFGFKKLVHLTEPDAGYTTNLQEFICRGFWNLSKIQQEIVHIAEEAKPTVVITMLPRHDQTHAHHQLVGDTTFKLFQADLLGTQVQAIYGEPEIDWLDEGAFANEEKSGLHFSRLSVSKKTGRTWGSYQLEGASFHQSQDTGHPDKVLHPHDYEVLVPLFEKEGTPSILRELSD